MYLKTRSRYIWVQWHKLLPSGIGTIGNTLNPPKGSLCSNIELSGRIKDIILIRKRTALAGRKGYKFPWESLCKVFCQLLIDNNANMYTFAHFFKNKCKEPGEKGDVKWIDMKYSDYKPNLLHSNIKNQFDF